MECATLWNANDARRCQMVKVESDAPQSVMQKRFVSTFVALAGMRMLQLLCMRNALHTILTSEIAVESRNLAADSLSDSFIIVICEHGNHCIGRRIEMDYRL